MGAVPESMISSADWQLLCTDGRRMPCHSVLLGAVSKVLASLLDSTGRPQNGLRIDVPFEGSSALAESFLKWVYQRTTSQIDTDSVVYCMARLGHYLDCPGLVEACDMVIWTRNHKKPVTQPPQPFVPTQPSPPIWLTAPIFIDGQKKEMDAFEWAVLASECGMPNLADMCVARMALVRKEWRGQPQREVARLSSDVLAQLLFKVTS